MTIAVVGAAVVRDGRVLAARRVRPPALAGGWEFPGGKVEAGERGAEALVRECREELGVGVRVGARLGSAADGRIELTLYAAALVEGEPEPLEDHDMVRWLSVTELEDVPWLRVDRALLGPVRALLERRAER